MSNDWKDKTYLISYLMVQFHDIRYVRLSQDLFIISQGSHFNIKSIKVISGFFLSS